MKDRHQHSSSNPTTDTSTTTTTTTTTTTSSSSFRSRFAKGFLRALTKINRRQTLPGTASCSPSPRTTFQRYRRIKTAADKSLASAAGSGRIWTRALLSKIRYQARMMGRRRHRLFRRINSKDNILRNKRMMIMTEGNDDFGGNFGRGATDELRKLVPGGEGLDVCRLLDETADYIKCLNTQVQVMRCIADFYSST